MIEDIGVSGAFKSTDELALEGGEPVVTRTHGLKLQQYLHGNGEVVAHVSKPEEKNTKPYCFNAEEIERRIGNLDIHTCIEEQRVVLKEIISLGNLGKLSNNDLQRLIAMDTALGNLL